MFTAVGAMFALVALAMGAEAQRGTPQTKTTDETMVEDRAKGLFEDPRVKAFVDLAQGSLGGKCTLPSYKATKAKVTSPAVIPPGAPPDAISIFYEVRIPCTGKASGMTLRGEFAGPAGPLNLTLSIDLKE
jgi:hypothetical protein